MQVASTTIQRKPEGTLLPEEFRLASEALAQRWEETCPAQPPWSWIRRPGPSSPTPTSTGSSASEVEIDDDTSLALDEKDQLHVYDFHIVYSFSYRVPVLYFRGYKYGGQPLNLRQIEDDLPLYSSMILKESKWTYITQEEHPFLHRPWYMLHPCGTSEWMKLLLGDAESGVYEAKQYLVSWLSVVGPAVGLRIPLEMQSRFQHAINY